jgi:LmbE family N-acetylglucosaminyl deacetylase
MSPPELPLRPERVLAIGAHPDDIEFFAGGTVLRLREQGARVVCAVCTDGGRGGRGLDDPAAVRRAEQARAADILGVEVVGLGHADGELTAGEPLRTELIREIRRVRPELVLAHDPATLWQRLGDRVHLGHSDHRAAGQTALDAVYPRAMSPNFTPELGLAPWAPREIWLFDTARPDTTVDITGTIARKLEALRAHESQNAGGFLASAAEAAAKAASGGAFPAEAFVRLRLR